MEKPTEEQVEAERSKTMMHIAVVTLLLDAFMQALDDRKVQHDVSKLSSPEAEMFAVYGPKLKGMTYGSEEYKQCLAEMRETALEHHYQHNRHHPEHFTNGIAGMNLVDLVEMVLDWKASSMRHADGDFRFSVAYNAKRFGIPEELASIIANTADLLDEWAATIHNAETDG